MKKIFVLLVALVVLYSCFYNKKDVEEAKDEILNDNYVEENYAGHTVVKTFNKEKSTIEEFEAENERYYNSSWKAQFISGLIMPLAM